jgi:hypothetical protein
MNRKTPLHQAIKWALSGPDPRRQSLALFSMHMALFSMHMGVRPDVWWVISNL